jgi:predicted permease
MWELQSDLRLAVRRFIQRPGFAVVAVLTLALGLGANTAIFRLVHAAMLQTLPVARPDELVRLGDDDSCCVNRGLQKSYSLFSYAAYVNLRDHTPDLASLAAFQARVQSVGIRRVGAAGTESVPGAYVSANYFTTFGVRPAAGRLLEPDDDRLGADPVFVMSHRAWVSRFGGDPSLVGAAFLVAGQPMTLAGVAEETFFGDTIRPDPAVVWIPLGQEPYLRGAASILNQPETDWLYAIGRLAPGATRARVEARLTDEHRRWLAAQSFLTEEDRTQIGDVRVHVVSARGGVALLRYTYSRPLALLFAMSGLVLLIASANLANLLLARTDRQRIAVQAALGASSGRLIRQSLTEGLLLSIAGAVGGLLVASFAAQTILALALPSAGYVPVEAGLGTSVLAFAFVLAVATGALFSSLPAWAMARANPSGALHAAGRSGEHHSFVPRRALVILQVALSLVLLACAGLLAESLRRLELQPLGFETDGRIVVHIIAAPPAAEPDRLAAYYARMRSSLLEIPGVLDATYSLYSPMDGNNWSSPIRIEGRAAPAEGDFSSWNRVGPRYFETTGTRVVRGRTITERDTANAARVAAVNEAFVRRFFPDSDPLGRRLGIGGDPSHAGDFEIVGITEDVKYAGAERPTRPMIFLPMLQVAPYEDVTERNVQLRSTVAGTVVLHSSESAAALEPAVRRALAAVDPDLAVARFLSIASQVDRNFQLNRLMARLTSAYAFLALTVAAVGLYGVTAYAVVHRTREIGVRMALGAGPPRVLRDILGSALGQTGVGLLLGLPAAFLATRALSSLLYGVDPRNPIAFGLSALVLLVSAALAAVVPARRAAAIEPTRALRAE